LGLVFFDQSLQFLVTERLFVELFLPEVVQLSGCCGIGRLVGECNCHWTPQAVAFRSLHKFSAGHEPRPDIMLLSGLARQSRPILQNVVRSAHRRTHPCIDFLISSPLSAKEPISPNRPLPSNSAPMRSKTTDPAPGNQAPQGFTRLCEECLKLDRTEHQFPVLKTFVETLSDAYRAKWSTRDIPCHRVAALLARVHWEEDDLGVREEVHSLASVIRNSYHFKVETWAVKAGHHQLDVLVSLNTPLLAPTIMSGLHLNPKKFSAYVCITTHHAWIVV